MSAHVSHTFAKGRNAEVLFLTAIGSGSYFDKHTWEILVIAKDGVTPEQAIGVAIKKVEKTIDAEVNGDGMLIYSFDINAANMARPVSGATLDKGILYRVTITSEYLPVV